MEGKFLVKVELPNEGEERKKEKVKKRKRIEKKKEKGRGNKEGKSGEGEGELPLFETFFNPSNNKKFKTSTQTQKKIKKEEEKVKEEVKKQFDVFLASKYGEKVIQQIQQQNKKTPTLNNIDLKKESGKRELKSFGSRTSKQNKLKLKLKQKPFTNTKEKKEKEEEEEKEGNVRKGEGYLGSEHLEWKRKVGNCLLVSFPSHLQVSVGECYERLLSLFPSLSDFLLLLSHSSPPPPLTSPPPPLPSPPSAQHKDKEVKRDKEGIEDKQVKRIEKKKEKGRGNKEGKSGEGEGEWKRRVESFWKQNKQAKQTETETETSENKLV